MNIDSNTQVFLGQREIVEIRKGNVTIWQKSVTPQVDYFYVENTYAGSNPIVITTTQSGSPTAGTYATSVEYSKDKTNWTSVALTNGNPVEIPVSQGEKVYFRNNSGKWNYYDGTKGNYKRFTCNKPYNIGGNIMSLLDYTNINTVSLSTGCFYYLFYYDTNLTDCSNLELPAVTLVDWCYSNMFRGTGITSAPDIPATTVAYKCCESMFRNCASLVNPMASLPATTLAANCYENMFQSSAAMVSTPALPATVVPDYAYTNMFRGGSSISTVRTIGMTSLGNRSCSYMFEGCSNITTINEFDITVLGVNSCQYMFANCTRLTNTPKLSATTLTTYCYQNMFRSTAISKAPELPATVLDTYSYKQMFIGCSNLNEVTVYATDISATDSHYQWLDGVAATGTFYNYGTAIWPTNSTSGIPTGWTEVKPVDYFYIENTYNGTNTLTLTTTTAGSPSSSDYSTTVQYSKDRTNWTTVTFDTSTPTTISMNQGEKVYFRNNNGKFNYFDRNSKDYHTSITCSESNNAGGNLNSLLDYTNIETVTLPIGAFYRLFSGNSTLKDASDIKIKHTVLKDYSHGYLFSGCSSLVEVPDFSRITTLGYGSMCNVFYNCSGLVTPPDFDSLVTTGERSGLSWAFYSCTSLQRPPRFPSLTTVGYYGLNRCFMNCQSLTYGSDLSSVTNLGTRGLERMYSSCSMLSSATVPTLSSWTTGNSSDWLAGVAATGTLYNYGTSTIPTGTSGVPSGWTVVTQ